jgi:hypothetical protein
MISSKRRKVTPLLLSLDSLLDTTPVSNEPSEHADDAEHSINANALIYAMNVARVLRTVARRWDVVVQREEACICRACDRAEPCLLSHNRRVGALERFDEIALWIHAAPIRGEPVVTNAEADFLFRGGSSKTGFDGGPRGGNGGLREESRTNACDTRSWDSRSPLSTVHNPKIEVDWMLLSATQQKDQTANFL